MIHPTTLKAKSNYSYYYSYYELLNLIAKSQLTMIMITVQFRFSNYSKSLVDSASEEDREAFIFCDSSNYVLPATPK